MQLRERLDALDDLDIRFGDCSAARYVNDPNARIAEHVKAMRANLEAVNSALYESIRSMIVHGASGHVLLQWIQAPASREETASGFGYDYRDEAVTGILQLREPSETRLHPLPEMVFSQPTPVRHILYLIRASALSQGDVFVDLGSGSSFPSPAES